MQITIQINAPGHALDQELFPLELEAAATVRDLKSTVHGSTGFEIERLQFYLNGQPLLGDSSTLDAAGIKDGELLAMLVREDAMPTQGSRQPQQPRAQPQQQQQQQQANRGTGMSNEQIETVRLRILGNAAAVQQVSQQHPEMATAILDQTRFRELYIRMQTEENDRERERMEQMKLLNDLL